MDSPDSRRCNVLIVGGGVAALEAALALRDLAGELVTITLLAPQPAFVYRPLAVLEPFSDEHTRGQLRSYPLAAIAGDIGVELRADSFKWLDAASRLVHTEAGAALGYDVLLLAMGARLRPRFKYARTVDDRLMDSKLHGLIQDVEDGYIRRLAFVIAAPMPWPLPLYELALLTAGRARECRRDVAVTLATPEDSPLAIFGEQASAAVASLLERHDILAITSAQCDVPEAGRVTIEPGGRTVLADSVVALPQLFGPATPGLPKSAPNGFISVDEHGRVIGLDDVYAAGDATDFAIKHGGIAAQQADAAAESIAARAGAQLTPAKFDPRLRAILLGGEEPLYLSARVTGRHGSISAVTDEAPWKPAGKIGAKYLAPYLAALDRAAAVESPVARAAQA